MKLRMQRADGTWIDVGDIVGINLPIIGDERIMRRYLCPGCDAELRVESTHSSDAATPTALLSQMIGVHTRACLAT